ncbi:hypothetical protein E1091_07865 [Micromonospora fluostatini]|uniref:DUF3039 domain-containing protein n=1 Tax=Micromonospora fluostatini TaxID=1629071 RepID=A0ABY2DIU5_9ACTN|nr:hypothetical protein E1091_07865 [Micromonospora fluostatini]
MTVVYSWDSGGYFTLESHQRAAVDAFVRAHDVEPALVPVGNVLRVEADDAGFWLCVWRATEDPGEAYDPCPYCPECIRQELVRVPLVAPAPELPGAYIDRDSGLPVGTPAES